MSSQQIIGLERVLESGVPGQTWNNKKIRWSIVHNTSNQTKPYDIQLQMVLVSSKRIVRVNGQIKDTQMCSFGYEAKFDISEKIKGRIKQDSLSFQFFANGQSFTKLQSFNTAYQPPKLDQGLIDPWGLGDSKKQILKKMSFNYSTKDKKHQTYKQQQQKIVSTTSPIQRQQKPSWTKSSQYQPSSQISKIPVLKHKSVSSQKSEQKKITQSAIKDTQNELIRILMEEKKRKKQEKSKAEKASS